MRPQSAPRDTEGAWTTGTLDDETPASDGATFAALMSELARAPNVQPERTLAAGERAGEHVIVEEIGRGGFGTVYRAVHPVLGGEVAIKVLNSAHAADPSTARRFVEEARAIHRIHHPNIVNLFGFGELPSGQLYYAMELLRGRTLSVELARGAVAPPAALAVLQQVADALDAAHAHGVLHRDLKPENIFVMGELGPNCRVKLLDFGIAKLLGDDTDLRTRTGALIGTPGYMSPEQCAGDAVDLRSDLYALGVIAFELLTGERLFPARNLRQTIAQHMFREPRRASRVRPSLPAVLDAPLGSMLDKLPARRPSSAGAAVRALADALATPSDTSVSGKRVPRMRWMLMAAAALVASWVAHWSYSSAFRRTSVSDSAKVVSPPRRENTQLPSTSPVLAVPQDPVAPAAESSPVHHVLPEKTSVRASEAVRKPRARSRSASSDAPRTRRELEF